MLLVLHCGAVNRGCAQPWPAGTWMCVFLPLRLLHSIAVWLRWEGASGPIQLQPRSSRPTPSRVPGTSCWKLLGSEGTSCALGCAPCPWAR